MAKPDVDSIIDSIQYDIIGTDAGNRGMKPLIVKNDLKLAARAVACELHPKSTVLVLSGFPCCVTQTPPTETDGPPGTMAIARALAGCGHDAIVVTDECNRKVFAAALDKMFVPKEGSIVLECFPGSSNPNGPYDDAATEERFQSLSQKCAMIISCERAGPGKDGNCYTMRGINMTEKSLIAPLHRFATQRKQSSPPKLFLAIGDGGNELGMGKVIDNIIQSTQIADGDKIGCVIAADHLIAASVSNWGGYALAAAVALQMANKDDSPTKDLVQSWIEKCVPTEKEEVELLNRCVAVGCRDGVSGLVEATVDGMPLERSMKCLRDIRQAALS